MFWEMFKVRKKIVEVYKNPSCYEIMDIHLGIPGVRAVLVDKKDLYVWEYDSATHGDMIYNIKGKNYFDLIIIIENDMIVFQMSNFASKEIMEREEFLEIPIVKKLVKDLKINFFEFGKNKETVITKIENEKKY